MKFGGTSVGDASCIAKVCEIVKEASHDHSVIVVVSAMSGVTNRLIEAATRAEAGERDHAALLIDNLRNQHDVALNALVHDAKTRKRLTARIEELLKEAAIGGPVLYQCFRGTNLVIPCLSYLISETYLDSNLDDNCSPVHGRLLL